MLPIKQQPDAPPGNDDVTVLRVQCAKTPPAQSMQLRSAGMCCRPNRRRSLHPDRRPQEYLDDTVYPYSRVPRQNLALPRSPDGRRLAALSEARVVRAANTGFTRRTRPGL